MSDRAEYDKEKKRHRPVRHLAPLYHLFVAFWLGVGLVAIHVLLHVILRPYYLDTTKPTLQAAAQVYQILYQEGAGQFRVYQGEDPWSDLPADRRVGPLGIGELAAIQGLFTQKDRELGELTRGARAKLEAFLGTFRNSGSMRDREVAIAGAQWIVSLPADESTAIRALDLRAAVKRTRELVGRAACYRRGTATRGVRGGANPAANAVASKAVAANDKLAPLNLEPVPMPPDVRAALLVELDLAFVDDAGAQPAGPATSAKNVESSAQAPKEPKEPGAENLARLRASLAEDIVKLAEAEVFGCFWLFGCLRWVEVVFWVWFGIVTKMLYGYGRFAVGREKKRVFEPNETYWALGRFVFAPLLAFVFFWLATLTNLVDFGLDLRKPTMATLAVAFLIGMFPDDIYTLVTTLFHRLLKGTTEDDRPSPARRSVEVAADVAETAPSLLAGLKNRVQAVVAGVVAPVSPR